MLSNIICPSCHHQLDFESIGYEIEPGIKDKVFKKPHSLVTTGLNYKYPC